MAASVNPNQVLVGAPLESARRDFRQEVTDRIIHMLETGVAPWQKPWNPADASLDMPMNPTTGKAYRGGNAIHLMATGLLRGYGDPRWMTYRQAAGLAWQVRRGEKGTQIEFWEMKAGRDTRSEPVRAGDGDGHRPADEPDAGRGNRLIHRVYTVFNAKQIEGIPEWTPNERSIFDVVEAAEHILKNSGATIHHDQADRSFYSRSSDSIHLPQSTLSRTQQATTTLRCMSSPTGPATRHAWTARLSTRRTDSAISATPRRSCGLSWRVCFWPRSGEFRTTPSSTPRM